MIKSVKLRNFLSFGPNSQAIEMKKLNVIVGRNGSGKSNFIEALDLLRHTPDNMSTPIRDGGGAANWLYKGSDDYGKPSPATMEFVLENRAKVSQVRFPQVRYNISFAEQEQRFVIIDESLMSAVPEDGQARPFIFYTYGNGRPMINVRQRKGYNMRNLVHEEVAVDRSIFSQRSDIGLYPEITTLQNELRKIKLYREWQLGRYTAVRKPVGVDAPNDFMEENYSNLPLVLNKLEFSERRPEILRHLRLFYQDVEDYRIRLESATAQLFFIEANLTGFVPATRLSDGTLRYLFLLCILLHPEPPALICIEEPELGLHPDILPTLGRLLIEASDRCQIIVTTHSSALIDSLSEHPEFVLIAEKTDEGTELTRLDKDDLDPWLKEYSLGSLWVRGDIGGTIW